MKNFLYWRTRLLHVPPLVYPASLSLTYLDQVISVDRETVLKKQADLSRSFTMTNTPVFITSTTQDRVVARNYHVDLKWVMRTIKRQLAYEISGDRIWRQYVNQLLNWT